MTNPLKFDVYLQDPLVAREHPLFGFDEIEIPAEPVIFDGPTSARFAVVDYNAATGVLNEPAKWDAKRGKFKKGGRILDRHFRKKDELQFHQVQVWASLQRALLFFEEGEGLGRKIPWAFEGNRLIVVPHAGYGQNAYYDRASKSLQFYYYNDPNTAGKLIYTCLSADIIHHEFGHAVLDGIRPQFMESHSLETAAFHEFVGDMTALLLVLRNNDFRKKIAEKFGDELSEVRILSGIADEFGRTVKNQAYLRNADNNVKMGDVQTAEPHAKSVVLTGAIFKIMEALSKQYVKRRMKEGESGSARKRHAKTAFWNTIQRMQRMAIQPLDFLPSIDATFKDYALAMIRVEEITNPHDPYGYRKIIIDEFVKRGVLTEAEKEELLKPDYLYDRNEVPFESYFSAYYICQSKENAYQFINENREPLGIPQNRDVVILGTYQAQKTTRQGRRLPRHFFLQYQWMEEVRLEDGSYAEMNGAVVAFPCGGTLVFDNENNLLHWANKPGTEFKNDADLLQQGTERLRNFMDNIRNMIDNNQLGLSEGGAGHLFASTIKPIVVENKNGLLHFRRTPHLNISDSHQKDKSSWDVSF